MNIQIVNVSVSVTNVILH